MTLLDNINFLLIFCTSAIVMHLLANDINGIKNEIRKCLEYKKFKKYLSLIGLHLILIMAYTIKTIELLFDKIFQLCIYVYEEDKKRWEQEIYIRK